MKLTQLAIAVCLIAAVVVGVVFATDFLLPRVGAFVSLMGGKPIKLSLFGIGA